MNMKETKEGPLYITQVEIVVNQPNKNGEMLSASRVVNKILRLLTIDFDNVLRD